MNVAKTGVDAATPNPGSIKTQLSSIKADIREIEAQDDPSPKSAPAIGNQETPQWNNAEAPPRLLQLGRCGDCDGNYLLIPDQTTKGFPMWERLPGESPDTEKEAWVFTSKSGRWVVGGSEELDAKFDCDTGFFASRKRHQGKWPHEITSEGWLQFDAEQEKWDSMPKLEIRVEEEDHDDEKAEDEEDQAQGHKLDGMWATKSAEMISISALEATFADGALVTVTETSDAGSSEYKMIVNGAPFIGKLEERRHLWKLVWSDGDVWTLQASMSAEEAAKMIQAAERGRVARKDLQESQKQKLGTLCVKCGSASPPESDFCNKCGSRLPSSSKSQANAAGIADRRHLGQRSSPTLAGSPALDEAISSPSSSSRSPRPPVKKVAFDASIADNIRSKMKAAAYTGRNGMQLDEIFGRLDRDNSGTLSFDEFTRALRKTLRLPKKDVSDDEAKVFFEWVDGDDSGVIQLAELLDFIGVESARDTPLADARRQASAKKVSSIKDRGHLDLALQRKIRSKFKAVAHTGKGVQLDVMFGKLDKDNSGLLNFDEFSTAVRKQLRLTRADISDKEVQTFFQWMDVDNAGSIELEELIEFVGVETPRETPLTDSRRKQAQHQQTQRGNLDRRHKIRAKLRAAAYTGTDGMQLDVIFGRMDLDNSGMLTLPEFSTAMRKQLKIPKAEISDQEVKAFFEWIDVDNTGLIEVSQVQRFADFGSDMVLDPVQDISSISTSWEPDQELGATSPSPKAHKKPRHGHFDADAGSGVRPTAPDSLASTSQAASSKAGSAPGQRRVLKGRRDNSPPGSAHAVRQTHADASPRAPLRALEAASREEFCVKCGNAHLPENDFCNRCGTKRISASKSESEAQQQEMLRQMQLQAADAQTLAQAIAQAQMRRQVSPLPLRSTMGSPPPPVVAPPAPHPYPQQELVHTRLPQAVVLSQPQSLQSLPQPQRHLSCSGPPPAAPSLRGPGPAEPLPMRQGVRDYPDGQQAARLPRSPARSDAPPSPGRWVGPLSTSSALNQQSSAPPASSPNLRLPSPAPSLEAYMPVSTPASNEQLASARSAPAAGTTGGAIGSRTGPARSKTPRGVGAADPPVTRIAAPRSPHRGARPRSKTPKRQPDPPLSPGACANHGPLSHPVATPQQAGSTGVDMTTPAGQNKAMLAHAASLVDPPLPQKQQVWPVDPLVEGRSCVYHGSGRARFVEQQQQHHDVSDPAVRSRPRSRSPSRERTGRSASPERMRAPPQPAVAPGPERTKVPMLARSASAKRVPSVAKRQLQMSRPTRSASARGAIADTTTNAPEPSFVPTSRSNAGTESSSANNAKARPSSPTGVAGALGLGTANEGKVYMGFRNGDGQREGYGVMRGKDGTIYTGQWRGGQRDGQGTLFFEGGVFEGQWTVGSAEGHGSVQFKNGDSFVGEYRSNKKLGPGTYKWADGAEESGEYQDGKKSGWHRWRQAGDEWDLLYENGGVAAAKRAPSAAKVTTSSQYNVKARKANPTSASSTRSQTPPRRPQSPSEKSRPQPKKAAQPQSSRLTSWNQHLGGPYRLEQAVPATA